MKERMPWFKFYPQDFLLETQDMTAEERGWYMALLCFQWFKGSIPMDCREMSKILRISPDELSKASATLLELFPKRGSYRMHLKLKAQQKESELRYQQLKKAGTKGAYAKHKPSIRSADAQHMEGRSESEQKRTDQNRPDAKHMLGHPGSDGLLSPVRKTKERRQAPRPYPDATVISGFTPLGTLIDDCLKGKPI